MVCFNKKEGLGEEPTKSDQLKIRILTFRQMQGAKKAPFCEKRGFVEFWAFVNPGCINIRPCRPYREPGVHVLLLF